MVLLRVSARITKLAQFVRFEGQLMGLNEFLTSQNHMKSRGYRSHFKSHSEYTYVERRETARPSGHAFGMELSTHDKQDASVGLLIKRLVNSSRVTEERAVAKGCEDS